jgi:hypothetical protein
MVLLAGIGAAVVMRSIRKQSRRTAVAALLLLGTAYLAWLSRESVTTYAADRRTPYVYAQTSKDVFNLANQLKLLGEASPAGRQVVIKVMAPESDYWPLPWYLRAYQNVGWWDQVPADPYAPVMIVSTKLQAALDENKSHLMVRFFELRPEVFCELYVELNLWRNYLAKHPPTQD